MLTNMFRKLTFSCLLVEVTFLAGSVLYLLYSQASGLYTGRPRVVSNTVPEGDQRQAKEQEANLVKNTILMSKMNPAFNSPMTMKNCPDGWPLQIIEVGENGNPTVQRCRRETSDGSWTCADGWERLDYSPFCILKTANETKNENSDDNILPPVRHPEYAPFSDDKKLLFIHVPKAGGTRIESSFLFDDQRAKLGHHIGGHHKISSFDKNYFIEYHKFCMVRHPCSRLVSIWEGFSRGLGNHEDQLWVESNLDDTSRKSFDAFIELSLFPGGPVHVTDETHLQPQVGMIFDENGTFGLNQMLIFERWNQSLDELERKIKVNVTSLKTSHRTTGRYKPCQEMYNPETWRKLVKIYALDFCVLGYSTKLEEANMIPPVGLTPETLTKRFEKCKEDLTTE